MQEVIIFVIGALLGVGTGYFIATLKRNATTSTQTEVEILRAAKDASESRTIELKGEVAKLESKLQDTSSELKKTAIDQARVETEKLSLLERLAQHKIDIEEMEAKFKLQFENLANRIFDDKATKFKNESKVNLEEILNPFREKLTEFQKQVNDNAKEQFSLKNEIEKIVFANERITVQAENLTKALKGDSKTQGTWGEILLEKILEDSGLRKDIDYVVQGDGLEMRHPETGRIQKPDVVVKLPDGKHIIVDSKTSITHYERYCSDVTDEEKAIHLEQFLASVNQHVIDLEERRYQDSEKLGTPNFVLMFVPAEGAYMLAVQKDSGLQSRAWDKKVVLVCPSTLFATLRTIACVWSLELQNRNAVEIARRGGALYDKVFHFVKEMQKLGGQIRTVDNTFIEAMNRLSGGRGILRQVETLKALGAKAGKSLPVELIGGPEDEEPTPEAEAGIG